MQKKCTNCLERKNCNNDWVSWLFFVIGLIATISIRVVTVLMHLNPIYGKLAWYVGVIGFFLFFIYKFGVSRSRAKVITKNNLIDKFTNQKQLTAEENKVMAAIACSLISKRENLNYLFIFIISAIALLVAVYFDFIVK